MIKKIEELSMNAWPSLQTNIYDGWIIRYANGYTKRANSINPLYNSEENLRKKIKYCEKLFINKGLPIVFKLTQQSKPNDLDNELAKKGYKKIDLTSVQLLDLNKFNDVKDDKFIFDTDLTDNWLQVFCEFSNIKEKERLTLKKMLINSSVNNYYFKLIKDGNIIACGLGVKENIYFGLFDIIVDEKLRGKGYGAKLLHEMLSFAKRNLAQKAYLQVVSNNTPARKLYEKIGFKEIYKYWYRVKKI
jgi:N-acetylglutamate synthase